ncbi:hypothetical protein ZHAS_00013139 [Anopheles sinensis]|uniref:Uncharacterized protein n=1 Tax=Anopheles sinensis TaxID=74873 RepID=A0A084W4N6_ANOSI|nr:hypothetical protein ZHAS_00013139 [Anopheles sinensis]
MMATVSQGPPGNTVKVDPVLSTAAKRPQRATPSFSPFTFQRYGIAGASSRRLIGNAIGPGTIVGRVGGCMKRGPSIPGDPAGQGKASPTGGRKRKHSTHANELDTTDGNRVTRVGIS